MPRDHNRFANDGLKIIQRGQHGGVFLDPIFARQIKGTTRGKGQFIRGQEFQRRQEAR